MDPSAVDPGGAVVQWVCANQAWTSYVIGILLAHSGLSVLSATLKKFGITPDSQFLGAFIPIIRMLALDVKPPPSVIVSNAADVVRASPGVAAMTGANPDKMDAAADAIKTAKAA